MFPVVSITLIKSIFTLSNVLLSNDAKIDIVFMGFVYMTVDVITTTANSAVVISITHIG